MTTNLVITNTIDENTCKCQYCEVIISQVLPDGMIPSVEECYQKGNVPIPNFGWFCSQNCACKYEKEHDIKFARTKDGKIDYYNE